MSDLILPFGPAAKKEAGIPEKCGDCMHCGTQVIQIPPIEGHYLAYRCKHPHPRAKDSVGRPTGIHPDNAPPKLCPLKHAGLGLHDQIFYPIVNRR